MLRSQNTNVFENDCMIEALELENTNKNGHQYSYIYTAISSIAYIFGPKCYNFLRNYFPLRKHISPQIIDFNVINEILQEFTDGEQMNAILAIDADVFKDGKGWSILAKFPDLKTINPEKIYNTQKVYNIQPIDVDVKPFPIYIELTKNGSATQTTLDFIDLIVNILKEKKIIINFIATDSDHKYDSLHDKFFEIIFSLHK